MSRRRTRTISRVRGVGGVLLFSAAALISIWLALCHWRGIVGATFDVDAERAAGKIGIALAPLLLEFFGYLIWLLPVLLFMWSLALLLRRSVVRTTLWSLFFLFLVPVVGGLSHFLGIGPLGGLLGGYVEERLTLYFGLTAAPFLLLTVLVVMLLLAVPGVFTPVTRLVTHPPSVHLPRVRWKPRLRFHRPDWLRRREPNAPVAEAEVRRPGRTAVDAPPAGAAPPPEPSPMPRIVTREAAGIHVSVPASGPVDEGSYARPPFSLLDPPVPDAGAVSKENLLERAEVLVEKLQNFGVETRVTEVHPGPVVTRYELEPRPGVKIGQVVNLGNDLALAMKAARVRIVAPIPGKGTVGIEIPNDKPSTVYFSEVIQSREFAQHPSLLKIALGKDISGQPVLTDLESMPHLLIAGSTGSGKSVCLNVIIAGFLFSATPQELSFILIDPKMLELTPYNGIPHLKCPVICDAKVAVRALRWAVSEMENRYQLLARLGARDIRAYNEKAREWTDSGEEDAPRPLPYVVIVVDELADLMLTLPNEIESTIARLAQMARAVGIHMVLATQRPSVDVITGVIKANFPCRMAFRVPSKTDSRTILDQNGAESLLGKGDMLFMVSGKRDPVRVHASYMSSAEGERLVGHVRQQSMPPAEPFVDFAKADVHGAGSRGRDELFDEAARLVVKHQQGSVSLLQRRLNVGYARAARLIDMLEEAGVVGPFEGSKAREVLVRSEEFLTEGDHR